MRRPRRTAHELRALGVDAAGPARASFRPGTTDCHVLFAGGIHDARSAAMVAAAANAASEHGIRIGVLIGTAYLFTHEAVQAGAITETFQQASVAAAETVTLESGPGHATRCLPSPFAEHFAAEKQRLQRGGRRRRGAAPAARGAEHRPAADRVEGHRAQPRLRDRSDRAEADRDRPRPPVGRGHVHDRPGRDAARRGHHAGRAACRRVDGQRRAAGGAGRDRRDRGRARRRRRPTSRSSGWPASCPGRPNARTLWSNILGKVDAITEIPARRWDWRVMYDADPSAPDKVYSRWGGFIDPVAFSPIEIGMPPKSVASIEPFQLLALITAQAALRRRRLRDPAVRSRAHVGDPRRRRRRRRPVGRLHGPLGVPVVDRRPGTAATGVRPAAGMDRGQLRRDPDERRGRPDRQPARLRRHQLHRRRGLCVVAGGDRDGRQGAAAGEQRHGARGRRRRDPESVRVPLLRQDPRALSDRTLPTVRRGAPTGSRSARASRPSCSNGWPTPSATATASTP